VASFPRSPVPGAGALGLLCVLALSATTSPASAATASVSGTTLSYLAAPGEVNQTSVFLVDVGSGLGFAVRELGAAPVVAGSGCISINGQMAWCGATATALAVSLGDSDDTLNSNDLGGVINGGPGNDTLVVSQFNSGVLNGDAGNDVLIPAFGVWTLNGGADDDVISGGCAGFCGIQGPLTVTGGAGTDRFTYAQRAEPVTVTLDGVANDGSGTHSDNIGGDVEDVVGGDASDTLTGSTAPNVLDGSGGDGNAINGGGGADTLIAFTSSNTLDGGADDDLIRTGGGIGADANVVKGGTGVDTADFSSRSEGVVVTLNGVADDGIGHDNIGTDVENLTGTEFPDRLIGGAGANMLRGGSGDDVVRGEGGPDILNGGAGTDTADYADHAAGVLVNPNGASVSGNATDGPSGARDAIGTDVENLSGGSGDDTLVDSTPANRFAGGPGTDTVDYSTTPGDLTVTIDNIADDGTGADDVRTDVESVMAGGGDDLLEGSDAANRLDGGAGADALRGGAGPDTLIGGAGEDLVLYDERLAPVTVQADGSPLSGSAEDGAPGARDTVAASVEDILGGDGNDTLTGNPLDNILDGGPGDDVLNGGAGEDAAYYGDRLDDLLVTLDGTADDGDVTELDNVGPTGDIEDVIAGAGDDELVGNASANALDGGPGSDILDGGTGPDVISGGPDFDFTSYLERTEPVTAAIDGAPTSGSSADGSAGARDTIAQDVEALLGGAAGDRLEGDAGDNVLYGGDGPDTLLGGPGFDAADYSDRTAGVNVTPNGLPGSGNDADGAAGARDTVATDIEDLFGGSGADTLTGSSAMNFIDAGAGDDSIMIRDTSADDALCADGTDTVFVDATDDTDATCESVLLPAPTGSPPVQSTQAPDTTPPTLGVTLTRRQTRQRLLGRGLALKTTCSEACRVRGQLIVKARDAKRLGLSKKRTTVVVARGSAASAGSLVLKFTGVARKHLKRVKDARRVTLVLKVDALDAAGNGSQFQSSISIRGKRVSIAALSRRASYAVATRTAQAWSSRLERIAGTRSGGSAP
jgi:Ca2+-binding RTX toxin-like protein